MPFKDKADKKRYMDIYNPIYYRVNKKRLLLKRRVRYLEKKGGESMINIHIEVVLSENGESEIKTFDISSDNFEEAREVYLKLQKLVKKEGDCDANHS